MKILLVAALLGLLAACETNRPIDDRAPAIYDLGTPVARPPQAILPRAALEVRLPLWFDDAPMRYRLHYADSGRLREYVSARWAAPPSQLLQQRLRLQLGLAAAQASGEFGCLILLDVDEFGQNFASPGASTAVLRGEARLLDRTRRRQVASQSFNLVEPSAPDAQGGAQALAKASDALSTQLRDWVDGLTRSGTSDSCRSP